MTCDLCREKMMDALYGEDLDSNEIYLFFQHLDTCSSCSEEHQELLETRDLLTEWEIDSLALESWEAPAKRPVAPPVTKRPSIFLKWGSSWEVMQRVAAAILIVAGAASILQSVGLLGGTRMTVSETQLMEMVNDLVVARMTEEERIIGQALSNFYDEVSSRQRTHMGEVSQQLISLQERYVDAWEENNRNLRTLINR